MKRRRAIGAEVVGGGVHFRVWAPAHEKVGLVVDGREMATEREPRGYFSAFAQNARAGALYQYRIDGELFPDPASRGPTGRGADRASAAGRGIRSSRRRRIQVGFERRAGHT